MPKRDRSFSFLHLSPNLVFPDMFQTAGLQNRKVYINGSILATELGSLFFMDQALQNWIHKAGKGLIKEDAIAESDNWTGCIRLVPKEEAYRKKIMTRTNKIPWGIFIS